MRPLPLRKLSSGLHAFRFGLGSVVVHAIQRLIEHAPVTAARLRDAEEGENGRRDVDVAGRQLVAKAGANVGTDGDEGVVNVLAAERAVRAAAGTFRLADDQARSAVLVFQITPAK